MKFRRMSYDDAKKEINYMKFFNFLMKPPFDKMTDSAKILYTFMRNRLKISIDSIEKGDLRWIDKDGNVFINASIETIMEVMNCANKKACKLKKELKELGLIEDVRVRHMETNRIYVNDVETLDEAVKSVKCQNDTSSCVKSTPHNVSKRHTTKNNITNTKKNNKPVPFKKDFKKPSQAQNYEQREYTDEFFEQFEP